MTMTLAMALPARLINLNPVDWVIIGTYFLATLGLGFYLKRFSETGEDFFLAGRQMTAWVAGLSFLAANLSSLELMGWAASSYEYGILATHWYWIGAVPAMLFLGVVMMPFYYISKTHSVPGYLQLRYGEPTRMLSAICFAFMTVLVSGVNMYAMALVLKIMLGWNISFSIWISAFTVAIYVGLGGLRSAIFNEVLQFMLIWAGAIVISILGLIDVGGWSGLVARIHAEFPGQDYTHLWSGLGSFTANPMGVHWTGIVFGLGLITSFGYWTTDFLVVQRVLAAKDLRSAQMAPIIAAGFKFCVPFIVILPGLLGLAVLPYHLVGQTQAAATGAFSYNEVLPLMLARYCGPGLLGLGITALIAGFMSGMAGNVSAFATVWTYDLYRPMIERRAVRRGLLRPAAAAAAEVAGTGDIVGISGVVPEPLRSDKHYVRMGRASILVGVLISIGTAYFVMQFASIMDYVQALFSFFIAPLFGTVILGMLWKRTTGAGGFWGLLSGTCTSVGMWLAIKVNPGALAYVALSSHAKAMAANLYQALWSGIVCVLVTVVVSLATAPRPEAELNGLVYGCTLLPDDGEMALYQRPWFWAAIVFTVLFIGNLILW
ncbi:MAG TPA: sodium:solute symporter family protein [Terriglobales bacterium]|jgi:SSS family solute:Na+ symporter